MLCIDRIFIVNQAYSLLLTCPYAIAVFFLIYPIHVAIGGPPVSFSETLGPPAVKR